MLIVNENGQLEQQVQPDLRPIAVAEEIIHRVWVLAYGEEEIVLLEVDPNEFDFTVKQKSHNEWMVMVNDRKMWGGPFQTDYIFGEPLKVKGKVGEVEPEYNSFAELIGRPKERILILERVNKSQ